MIITLSPNDVRRIVVSGEWPKEPLFHSGVVQITNIEDWLNEVARFQRLMGLPDGPDGPDEPCISLNLQKSETE